ncbi:MAG TPA: hypothetical protein P5080_04020 [Candidatus Paceibacterota bacterium]|nr:hypothetical protein [Candidatus Pacearchaeota archaeon]HRZ51152.1 hypothetical protein [Candidatus Paceibacterota bacterium]HSA36841.1 hypothetical protein [Candidatus Paceibacterota bacterium]
MKIWIDIVKTQEALKRIGKSAAEVPIKTELCAIMVVEPTDDTDYSLVDIWRRAFFEATMVAREKCGVFATNNGNSKKYVFLLATERTVIAESPAND